MGLKAIPDGYHTINVMAVVEDPEALVQFCEQVFGGEAGDIMQDDQGRLQHAGIAIGDSTLMIGRSSAMWGPSTGTLYLYVDDVDGTYKKAVEAGAKSVQEPQDQFWGDRNGGFTDASGIQWWVARHIEDVAPDEMDRRAAESMQQMKAKQQAGNA